MFKQSQASISEVKEEAVVDETITAPDIDHQERAALNKTPAQPKPSKHKKRNFVVITIFFLLLYYLFIWLLAPEGPLANGTSYQEAVIDFNTTLGKNYTWVQQKLDHYGNDGRAWMQRVLLDLDPSGISSSTPIFLSLPNMAPVKETLSLINLRVICKAFKCAQLALQPRYFGESKPLGDDSYTTENMKYLTLQQIVEDAAFAINRIITLKLFNITSQNPWIVCGQSYSGMIATMLRSKYPHLIDGAYASSPLAFQTVAPKVSERFYETVISGGKKCRAVVHSLMQELQEAVYGEQKQGFLLDMGRGTALLPNEALYLFMKRITQFHRNQFIKFCSSLDEQSLQGVFKSTFFHTNFEETDPLTYSAKQLSLTEEWRYFQILRMRRAYQWLRCTQMGLFQTNPSSEKKHLNFKELDERYFRQYCSIIFSQDLWPDQSGVAEYFQEGLKGLTQAIIVHGYYDIWLPYGFKPQSATTEVFIVKCSECVHNFAATVDSSVYEQVEKVRQIQTKRIGQWIASSR